jgi:ribulose-5-phosphate 4-epimerase/fuculose-1-phosphate aldolase
MGTFGRRALLACACAGVAALLGAHGARAQAGPADAREKLVLANKILAMEGLVGPFGHVSLRLGPTKFLIASHDAGPWIEAGDLIELEVDLQEELVKTRGLYSEVFIHSSMYREHAGVNAVVHTHSPNAIALGTLALPGGRVLPTTNPGANLGNFVPIFSEVGLIQNAEKGQKVSRALAGQNGVLLRGHGAVVVGGTIEQAVLRALYLEIESRVQLTSRPAGEPIFYRPEESDLFKETRSVEHPWEYLVEKVKRQAK